jgi:hypothetical protein
MPERYQDRFTEPPSSAAPSFSSVDQKSKFSPSQIVRLPGSGPKKPPREAVFLTAPKLLLLPVLHNRPLPATGPGAVASPGHEMFGLAKWGVLVKLRASARPAR